MVVRKRKSSRKYRGIRTHGYGFGKRHRGKGNKPYRSSGVGKRGAHRETIFLAKKLPRIGKHGIQVKSRVHKEKVILLKLSDLEDKFDEFVKAGIIKGQKPPYDVDLTLLGNTKLLANGNIKTPFNIKVVTCSSKVKEKVERAGGKILQ
ncbi:MAG: uL15m family ribosomal protein [Candidatus Nanoarchaeia archaeon]